MLGRLLAEWDDRPTGVVPSPPLASGARRRADRRLRRSLADRSSCDARRWRRRPVRRVRLTVATAVAVRGGARHHPEAVRGRGSVDGWPVPASPTRIAPVPPEPLEVWIGVGDAAIDRAARLGDAFLVGPEATPAEAAELLESYCEPAAATASRPPHIAIRRDVHVGADDADAERSPVRSWPAATAVRPAAPVYGGRREVGRLPELGEMGHTDVIVRHLVDELTEVLDPTNAWRRSETLLRRLNAARWSNGTAVDHRRASLDDLVAEVLEGPLRPRHRFHGERSYWPRLALIQIGWRNGVAPIDPFAVDPAGSAPARGTRMPSGSPTLPNRISPSSSDTRPRTEQLFDTQVAAGFVGLGSPSLVALVDRLLGVGSAKATGSLTGLDAPSTPNSVALRGRRGVPARRAGRRADARADGPAGLGPRRERGPAAPGADRSSPSRLVAHQGCATAARPVPRRRPGGRRPARRTAERPRSPALRAAETAPRASSSARPQAARSSPRCAASTAAPRMGHDHPRRSEDRPHARTTGASASLESDRVDRSLAPAVTVLGAWLAQRGHRTSILRCSPPRAHVTQMLQGNPSRLADGWRGGAGRCAATPPVGRRGRARAGRRRTAHRPADAGPLARTTQRCSTDTERRAIERRNDRTPMRAPAGDDGTVPCGCATASAGDDRRRVAQLRGERPTSWASTASGCGTTSFRCTAIRTRAFEAYALLAAMATETEHAEIGAGHLQLVPEPEPARRYRPHDRPSQPWPLRPRHRFRLVRT